MTLPFQDRRAAGRALADRLDAYRNTPGVIVLGLPRGGIPVAAAVAAALDAPLDVFLVRKLGVPGHEELAMGAIAAGGVRVLNPEVVGLAAIPEAAIAAVEAREQQELTRRSRLYRGSRPAPDVAGKIVLLIDDGLATGSTMRAAALALRALRPARIVAAAPVGSTAVCTALREVADEVICAETPTPFYAVGAWYEDFSPTSDAEVQHLLASAADREERTLANRPRPRTGGAARPGVDADVEAIRLSAAPLPGSADDYDALLAGIGNARFVLIGEASHGTHEFYRERARITRRLIEEHGFDGVAVEADWPDAWRVNRYVRGEGEDRTPFDALGDFHRFPRWMWRNTEVAEFVDWLRAWNDALPATGRKAGFYGLDLYSMRSSMDAVVRYLDWVDPEAARRARARYACFDHFGDDPQVYGYATVIGGSESCENEAVGQLVEMLRGAASAPSSVVDGDEHFFATQNARLVRNAEAYYRAMYHGRIPSWNLRDRHMAETLEALTHHLSAPERPARIVVWAHNSHLGDARATSMVAEGELNLGQLVRERHGDDAWLVGFTSWSGTVTAASDWDGPARRRMLRPALPGSYEALLHRAAEAGAPDYLLTFRGDGHAARVLRQPRLERAVGVIYRPETERFSHYFHASLPAQFDAVIHLDKTAALTPLDPDAGWEEAEELPETFPFGV